jgi:membrane fusion protein (multidrug efflux system)
MEAKMSEQTMAAARDLGLVERPPGAMARFSARRALSLGAALIVATGVAWYGHQWWTVGRFFESTDDAYVGGDITVLAPKVSGFIATVAVTDNQMVHAGDLLVRLDDRDYRAALAKADAGVASQRAKLASNLADRHLQAAVIAQSQAALDATAAQTSVTRFDVERYRSLAHDQFGSVQRFQQADADWKKATAADAQAHAALEAAQRQLDVIDAARVETEAALAAAVADQETARLNLGYTELRAPVDGAIGNRSAQVGAYVTPGAQLLSLVPAQGLWVDANFKENQLARLKPGMPVSVVADVLPGEVFRGHVASLAPATGAVFSVLPAENATGNFTKIVQRVPVRVLLDGEASRLGRLRPGLSVTASVDERGQAAAP